MDGADLCFEIVNRVHAGFVYSEAVARWEDKFILIVEVGDNNDDADSEKIINGNSNDDDNYMNLLWKSEIIESHSMLQIYSRKKYAMEYRSEGSAARLARVQGL